MVHKTVYPILMVIICILLGLVLYLDHRDIRNNFYYLNLSGESSHWKLNDYQIEITPYNFKSGNGKLYFKSKNNDYTTQFYVFQLRAIINNVDTALQIQSVSGPEDFKNGVDTGSIEGPAPITKIGDSITLKDVDEIYAVIQWEEESNGKTQKETMPLYSEAAKK